MNKYRRKRSKLSPAFPPRELGALPRRLRSLGQARYGGSYWTDLSPFKGGKLGAASRGLRITDPYKLAAIIRDLRERGVIT